MSELQVHTKVYTGPLDLLLFLVRRAEVDIYDLPVAEIADQYIAELQKMERVDLEFAGEYLVMAAQLLKVKSEMVLFQTSREGGEDPRGSLVRQLLEYKRFRGLAQGLAGYQADALRRHGRPDGLVPLHEPDDIYLDEVRVYDLFRQYARLTREITSAQPYRVRLDERPIEEYIALILDQLHHTGSVDFAALVGTKPSRHAVIGNFLALLELVRQGKVELGEGEAALATVSRRLNAVPAPEDGDAVSSPDSSASNN